MKRIFTSLLFLSVCHFANAQYEKKSVLLGGSLGFSSETLSGSGPKMKENYISLMPSAGICYANNRMAGVTLSYSHLQFPSNSLTSNLYGAGVFLRQIKPLGKSFFFFTEEGLNAAFGRGKQMDNISGQLAQTKQASTNLYFYPGLSYSIGNGLQLELGLTDLLFVGYTYQTSKPASLPKTTQNDFYVQTGLASTSLGGLAFGLKWKVK